MAKRFFAVVIFLLVLMEVRAQLGVMKLVGNNTKDYSLGFGAFIKTAFPVSEGNDLTFEIGVDFFKLNDEGDGDGTVMCPLKVGYRYTLNGTGLGFYLEPQLGYNLYGVTSRADAGGFPVDLKYHGVIAAIGTGYLFNIGRSPFDVNLRYETVIAHGGSNNLISLGIARIINFKKRDTDY